MSGPLLAFLVAVAGGLGAALRFVIDTSIPAKSRARFPWGTWLINITGSFVLGLIAGPLTDVVWGPIFTVGLLGGYTTFSAASLETVSLAEAGRWKTALFYGLGTLVLTTTAALTGVVLTSTSL